MMLRSRTLPFLLLPILGGCSAAHADASGSSESAVSGCSSCATEVTRAKLETLAVRVDGDRMYYAEHDAIGSAPLAGGPATPLVSGTLVDYEGDGLAVSGDYVYWLTGLNGRPDPLVPGRQRILRVPKSGGTAETFFDGCPQSNGDIYSARSFAVDETNAYVECDGPYVKETIRKVPLDGTSAPTMLAENLWFGKIVAVKSGYLYWTGGHDVVSEKIMRTSLSGTATEETLMTPPSWARVPSVAVGDESVYFRLELDGPTNTDGPASLGKVALTGGPVETLLSSFDGFGLVTDGKDVFYQTVNTPSYGPGGQIRAVAVGGGASRLLLDVGASHADLSAPLDLAGGALYWGQQDNQSSDGTWEYSFPIKRLSLSAH